MDLAGSTPRRLPVPEFVAMIAMQTAAVALSFDGLLPALPAIAAELTPNDRNRAQFVLTAFLLGMGIGTFFTGPLSDRFGRKGVIVAGAVLFIAGALWSRQAQTMEQLIFARILQGLGVSAPRIVAVAIIRDIYQGRRMAQILSYAMVVFTLVPAIAPFFGALVSEAYGWRNVFTGFILFNICATAWLMLRQPETLTSEMRRKIGARQLWQATKECFSYPAFSISALVQTLTYAILFATVSSVQPIFDDTYGRADTFPEWFAAIAVLGGVASVVNARLVMAFGMQRMIVAGFGLQIVISALILAAGLFGPVPFWAYFIWTTSIFCMFGVVIGNVNALAMEPVGHIAGLAASVLGAVSTVIAVVLAAPVGLLFNGTTIPLSLGTTLLTIAALATFWAAIRCRMF